MTHSGFLNLVPIRVYASNKGCGMYLWFTPSTICTAKNLLSLAASDCHLCWCWINSDPKTGAIHPGKLTWHWKITAFNRKCIFIHGCFFQPVIRSFSGGNEQRIALLGSNICQVSTLNLIIICNSPFLRQLQTGVVENYHRLNETVDGSEIRRQLTSWGW